ncbi:hypothetical protein R1flu_023013 [Riccia fluitans]|uniref:Uncharacterized protein n=1 Tax=Riccia fluitans TaxID=41844 RepID=A0ABD1XTV1_9MARC
MVPRPFLEPWLVFSLQGRVSLSTPTKLEKIARLPGEIGVLQSFMPLYSATANSRLVSRLGTNGDAPILQDDEDGT